MMKMTSVIATAIAVILSAGNAGAQGGRGGVDVNVTGNFGVGGTPRILVLPMFFAGGDSVRTIIERDLRYQNQVDLVPPDERITSAAASGEVNLDVFQPYGVTGVLRGIQSRAGITLELYEMATKKRTYSRDFTMPADRMSSDYRFAVHGAADLVHEWITGNRGIASTRIAYVHNESIWLIDFDGANRQQFVSGGKGQALELLMSPEWHPGGGMLAFSALRGSVHQIGTKPLGTGSAVRWLTNDRSGANSAPAFSKDGSTLFFSRSNGSVANIWAVPTSGQGAIRHITNDRYGENSSPALSPDGRIAIMSNRMGANPMIYIMDVDGTNSRAIEYRTVVKRPYLGEPAWSPDGSMLAFSSRGDDGYFQIETMPSSGRGVPTVRTSTGRENKEPSWAPDSRHIVFTSNRDGRNELWIVDTRSGRFRKLGEGGGKLPAWSPRLAREP